MNLLGVHLSWRPGPSAFVRYNGIVFRCVIVIFAGSDSVDLKVFVLSHRTTDKHAYWQNIKSVVDWTELYGFTGVLLFEGNDTFVSPWVAAQEALSRTKSLSPLVAVNPIYMHPFSAAKLVSSFAQIYNRKIYLNMITGTAVNYLTSMNDSLSHDERYSRVAEYIEIMRALLESTTPLTYTGRFYQVSDLQLLPGIERALLPSFLLSGQSEAASHVVKRTSSIATKMLTPKLATDLFDTQAINTGILCRETEDEAWEAARQTFPEDEESQMILDYSMQNTDSTWKKRMQIASQAEEDLSIGYWMSPFRNFQSDGPYLVGSYDYVSTVIVDLVAKGVRTFILDITPREIEYMHIRKVFDLALSKIGSA